MPKTWEEMSGNERWWLSELWKGSLKMQKVEAESRCDRVEADAFMLEDDSMVP